MAYGTIKVDTITFTDSGVDKSVSISGLVQNPTFSGNITVTGTVSGNTIQGQTVSGVTVTGTTANFTSGNFTTFTGGTLTLTSGVIASGTAANPSLSILGDTNTGIYSPGADQLAISTSGAQRLVVDASGNVGFGAAAPSSYKTYIKQSGTWGLVLEAASNDSRLLIGDVNGEFRFSASYAGTGAYRPLTFCTSDLERLRITSAGLVGVGVSAPSAPLHINADNVASRGQLSLSTSSAANVAQFSFYNQGSLRFQTYQDYSGNGDINFVLNGASANMGFWTNNLQRLTIDSSGRVGVGTTAPQGRVDISKTGASTTPNLVLVSGGVGDPSTVDPSIQFGASTLESVGTTKIMSTGAYGSRALAFHTGADGAGTEKVRVTAGGLVGIGVSAPSTALEVANSTDNNHLTLYKTGVAGGAGPGIRFNNQNNTGGSAYIAGITAELTSGTPGAEAGALVLSTKQTGDASPQKRVYISAGGLVGIGTASPSGNLHSNAAYTNTSDLQVIADGNIAGFNARSSAGGRFSLATGYIGANITSLLTSTSTSNPSSEVVRFTHSTGEIDFYVGGSGAVKIDASRRLLVGTSSTSASLSILAQGRSGSATEQAVIRLCRGSSPGTEDVLGAIGFGDPGHASNYNAASLILSARDSGTWTAGTSQPSRLVFSTTADGASSPTERLRITSAGNVGIGTTSPTSRLFVNGSNAVSNLIVNAGTTAFSVYNDEVAGEVRLGAIDTSATNAKFLSFYTNPSGSSTGTERARIDSSGRLLVGTSAAYAVTSGFSETRQQIVANDAASFLRYSADNSAETLWFCKSRNATAGQHTVLQSGDGIARFNFQGSDGTNFITAARIDAEVDGTPGSTVMPGRLVFSTNGTTPGAPPTERIRIDSNGFAKYAGAIGRGAPVTKTGAFTVGIAENWLICNGTASITVTLPTASAWTGREIMLKTIAAFTVISASSNVVPLVGGAAGTAILAATAGKYATLVSDGTNWIIMQAN